MCWQNGTASCLCLLGLSVLSEPWLTLTSAASGLQCHLANKHKYSVQGHHVMLQQCGHLHDVDIDNQTVNRVASNNWLIMNCK